MYLFISLFKHIMLTKEATILRDERDLPFNDNSTNKINTIWLCLNELMAIACGVSK